MDPADYPKSVPVVFRGGGEEFGISEGGIPLSPYATLVSDKVFVSGGKLPNSTIRTSWPTSCQLVGQQVRVWCTRHELVWPEPNTLTYRDVGLWQDQRPTNCTTCCALVLPEPNKLAIVEFCHKKSLLPCARAISPVARLLISHSVSPRKPG
jgi:hypothetical protein